MASCPGAGVAAPVRHHATTSHDIKLTSYAASMRFLDGQTCLALHAHRTASADMIMIRYIR